MRVVFAGQLIAQSAGSYRVLETSHPPNWYVPRADVQTELLTASRTESLCEWKGLGSYWTVRVGEHIAEDAAWSYESPNPRFAAIQGYLAFYPRLLECYIDNERVKPQGGEFYGGWITQDVVGPFKGVRGTSCW